MAFQSINLRGIIVLEKKLKEEQKLKVLDKELNKPLEALTDAVKDHWWQPIGHAAYMRLYAMVNIYKESGYDVKSYAKIFLHYAQFNTTSFDRVYKEIKEKKKK